MQMIITVLKLFEENGASLLFFIDSQKISRNPRVSDAKTRSKILHGTVFTCIWEKPMKSIRLMAWLNLFSTILQIFFSYATNAKLFNTRTVGEVSDTFNTLATPAGFTFSIWGVIYTLMLLLTVYHLVRAYKASDNDLANVDVRRIGWWLFLNNLAAICWLFAWINEYIAASVLIMLIQLVALITITQRLRIYDQTRDASSRFLTQAPLSIYLGWISIATATNIAAWFDHIGLNEGTISETIWTQLLIGLLVLLAVIVMVRRKNIFFGLVVIWALYGIAVKTRDLNADEYSIIIQTVWIGMILLAFMVIVQLITNYTRKRLQRKSSRLQHSHES